MAYGDQYSYECEPNKYSINEQACGNKKKI